MDDNQHSVTITTHLGGLRRYPRRPGLALPKRVLSTVVRLRVAPLYVLAVVAIGVVLDQLVDEHTRIRLVLANSTNVVNLVDHRIWTLVTSVFFLDGPVRFEVMIVLLIVTAAAEILWGWRRLVAVFLLANVLASIVVFVLLSAGADGVWFAPADDAASDVGVSYGAHAVEAALAAGISGRLARWILVPLVLLPVVLPMFGHRTFTDVGHLLSAGIGVFAGWQLRRQSRRASDLAHDSRGADSQKQLTR